MKNASDRLTNNLNVLNKHAMLIEEKCDFYDNSTEYTFNISDYQLSQLNITEANDVFMHGANIGKLSPREIINKIVDEEEHNCNCRCTMGGAFSNSGRHPWNSDDYKNKPHLRSNYMSDYDIIKVEVLNDRVVIMRFGDGSFTKAICTEDDAKNGKFDVDIGITICLIKKIIGETDGKKKAYAKLIRDIHKMMDEQDKQAKEEEQRKVNAKARKLRKAQRRAAAVKQENDMFRNDISDAVLYALERLEERKTEAPEELN